MLYAVRIGIGVDGSGGWGIYNVSSGIVEVCWKIKDSTSIGGDTVTFQIYEW